MPPPGYLTREQTEQLLEPISLFRLLNRDRKRPFRHVYHLKAIVAGEMTCRIFNVTPTAARSPSKSRLAGAENHEEPGDSAAPPSKKPGSADESSDGDFRVVWARVKAANLPYILIKPKNFSARLEALFDKTIKLSSEPLFSKRYVLVGKDAGRVEECMHPALVDYFIENDVREFIEVKDRNVVLMRQGALPPEQLLSYFEQVIELVRLFFE